MVKIAKRTSIFAPLIIAASALMLAGCSSKDDRTAGGVSESEANALDEAAEILDERRADFSDLSTPQDQQSQPAENGGEAENDGGANPTDPAQTTANNQPKQ